MRSLGGILNPFDIGKAFRFYLSSRPGCLCHNSCHLGNHWTYIHNMGIGEAENHGDGDGITIDDGDDNLGILWGGGTLQGRRSDTSPPATTWNVQLLHSPSQWGCSIAPVANGSPGANREVVVEAPLRLTRDHLMVKMFWENFSFPPGGCLPSKGRLQRPPWEEVEWKCGDFNVYTKAH